MTAPPDSLPSMDKTELIERSLRVFFFGMPGLIPFLGTPFAIIAMVNSARIKRRGPPWNPAQRYLFWGTTCAHIGTGLTVIIAVLLAAALILDLLT